MNPRNFFSELKRRRVYSVAVAYVVVAWLLIQVATQVFPFFNIPNWIKLRYIFAARRERSLRQVWPWWNTRSATNASRSRQ